TSEGALRDVVDRLERRPWVIFERLALKTLTMSHPNGKKLATERLLRKEYFESRAHRREYRELLGTYFSDVDSKDQTTIPACIDSGRANADEWAEVFREVEKRPPTDGERAAYENRWRFEWLWPMRESLTGEWKTRFAEWNAQFGEIDLGEVTTRTRARWGDP